MVWPRRSFLFAALVAADLPKSLSGQERMSKMKIRISLDGDRFLARESILLQLSLENTSGAMVEIPDPEDLRNPQFAYAIRGPAYAQGLLFKPRITLADPNSPSLIQMRPGEKLQAQLPLNLMFGFPQPGRYSVAAYFNWSGQQESIGSVDFHVETGGLKSARIMADDGFQRTVMQRVLALVGDPPRLYQFLFQEQRPVEISLTEMIRAAPAPPNAQHVVAPWTNFNRSDVLFARFGWQAPGALGIESGVPRESIRAALALETTVIAPALTTENGATTVFTYSHTGLGRWEFPAPSKSGPAPEARTRWTIEPASPIHAAAAALGPRPANQAYALTISAGPTGALATLYDGDGKIHQTAVPIEGARLLPNSQPTLWVGEQGAVNAAILFGAPDMPRYVFVAEINWNDGEPKVARREPVELPRGSRASTVAFSVTPKRPPRISWAILLDDESIVSHRSPNTPLHPRRAPLMPLQLLVMDSATYLLVADPVDFLGLDVLA